MTYSPLRLKPFERLVFKGANEVGVKSFVGAIPIGQGLHFIKPAHDVGIGGIVEANHLAEIDVACAHEVRQRRRVAADETAFAAKVMAVEDFEPMFGLGPAPGQVLAVGLLIALAVGVEYLRVDQAVTEIAIKSGVEPVHALVHPGACERVGRVSSGPEISRRDI